MHNDDIYPNDGAAYQQQYRDAAKDQREEELSETLEQVPLIKDVLEHLNGRIEFYGNVDSISADLNKDAEAHLREVAVNKIVRAELSVVRDWLGSRVSSLQDAALRQET